MLTAMSMVPQFAPPTFRLGGGPRGLYLARRYLSIIAASSLLLCDALWNTPCLLRMALFVCAALLYGHVISQIRQERQRADNGFAWTKEREDKVALPAAEPTRLYQESLAASRLRTEAVANMSHELRTPLTIILGYVEMLLDPSNVSTEEERQHILSRIQEAACRHAHLLDTVLDPGKVEAGKMPIEKRVLRTGRKSHSIAASASGQRSRDRTYTQPNAPDAHSDAAESL
jgi:signal transduction histidine kinase